MANSHVFQDMYDPFFISEECLPFGNTQPLGQINSTFQYPMNESFFPTYNPNIGWNPENNFGTQDFTPYSTKNFSWENSVSFNPQQNFYQPNLPYPQQNFHQPDLPYHIQSPHPQTVYHTPLDTGHDEHRSAWKNEMETNMKDLDEATDRLTQTYESFMKLNEHALSTNTQAFARMETQLAQLLSAISEEGKENLLSQSMINPENTEENCDEEISEEADQVFQNEENASETICGDIFLEEIRLLENNQQPNFYTSTMTLEFEEKLKEVVVKEQISTNQESNFTSSDPSFEEIFHEELQIIEKSDFVFQNKETENATFEVLFSDELRFLKQQPTCQIFINQESKFQIHNTSDAHPNLLHTSLTTSECSKFQYIIDCIILKMFKIRGRIFSNKVGFNVECELLMFYLFFYIYIFCLRPCSPLI